MANAFLNLLKAGNGWISLRSRRSHWHRLKLDACAVFFPAGAGSDPREVGQPSTLSADPELRSIAPLQIFRRSFTGSVRLSP